MRATVCETCGDRGEITLLITCIKCQDSAVHHYCLDKFSPDDDEITWMCGECMPKTTEVSPSIKSEQIILKKEKAVEFRADLKKRLKKGISQTAERLVSMKGPAEKPQLIGNCSFPWDGVTVHSVDENFRIPNFRRKRRILMEEGTNLEEDFESVKPDASSLASQHHRYPFNVSYVRPSSKSSGLDHFRNQELEKLGRELLLKDGDCLGEEFVTVRDEVKPFLESNRYIHAQPVMDPIWRGCFNITNKKNEAVVGIMAHLSNKACSKVTDVATLMPPALVVEILPRHKVWPKSFQMSPPTDDSIALFIFPACERDEEDFDSLLDEIIEHNLALKAVINDVELLVFSSLELPQDYWRFQRKYYMWGVFRPKQPSHNVVPPA